MPNVNRANIAAFWKEAKGRGISQEQAATEAGMTKNAFNSMLWRANNASKKPVEISRDLEESVDVFLTENGQIHAESRGARITTPDELIAHCKLDESKYIFPEKAARKWDVVLKNAEHQPVIVPSFYAAFKAVPRIIEQSKLDILPVRVAGRLPTMTTYPPKTQGRGIIIPDIQFGFRRDIMSGRLDPFHDRAALDIALQITQFERLDEINFLGDVMDLSEFSDKFVRMPEFLFTTQPAIYEANWWLQQFAKATPNARRTMMEGNHDYRLPLSVINHMMGVHKLKSANGVQFPAMGMEYLLDLPGMGIEYITGYPNNVAKMGPVSIVHGDIARSAPGSTVGALSKQFRNPVVQGHIHRVEQAGSAYSPGCLCRLDYVVPGHKRGQDWQQGLAVVEWDGDYAAVTLIPIIDGVAIYRGRKFTPRPRLDDLNKDTESVRNGWAF